MTLFHLQLMRGFMRSVCNLSKNGPIMYQDFHCSYCDNVIGGNNEHYLQLFWYTIFITFNIKKYWSSIVFCVNFSSKQYFLDCLLIVSDCCLHLAAVPGNTAHFISATSSLKINYDDLDNCQNTFAVMNQSHNWRLAQQLHLFLTQILQLHHKVI